MEKKDIELNSLIRLLEDPDEQVYNLIEKKLIEKGDIVIAALEKKWNKSLNSILHVRIENIIEKIQFNTTFDSLSFWAKNDNTDLLYGAYIVATHQYPDLKYSDIQLVTNKITTDVWVALHDNLTPLEQIRTFNHIFFEVHRFARNSSDYYAPKNSYINTVFESKKGNPVSLSIIYITIAQEIGLPIYGINLPKNFITAYVDEKSKKIDPNDNKKNLFYINPYNKGAILGKREIDFFLEQQNIPKDKKYYQPADNITIIIRLLENLIVSYKKMGSGNKVKYLQKLITIFN